MEENLLISELKVIQFRLDGITATVNELKARDEDRRASIDAVAHSLRIEQKQCSDQSGAGIEAVKRDIEKMKVELAISRWLGILIGGTALTLTVYKLMTAEASPGSSSGKPPIEKILPLP